MAHGDYCPKCGGMHDILKDCPPRPGVPVPNSFGTDVLRLEEEVKRLRMSEASWKAVAECAAKQRDDAERKGRELCQDLREKLILLLDLRRDILEHQHEYHHVTPPALMERLNAACGTPR